MECRNARSLVDEYLDGALDEAKRARVEAHLGKCELCRNEFDEVRRYRDAVSGLPRVKVPDDFLKDIHAKLAQETVRRKRWEFFTSPLPKTLPFSVAAAAVAAFALIFVLHIQQPNIEKSAESPATAPEGTVRFEKKADTNVRPAPAPSQKTGEIKVKSTPEVSKDLGEAASLKAAPVAITLVLERPPQSAGTAPTGEVETIRGSEHAREAESAREAEPKRLGARRDEAHGGIEGRSLDQAREMLASIIMKSGGRIVGTETEGALERFPEEPLFTVLAEIPAVELDGFLEHLGGLGRLQTDQETPLPESTGSGELVALRIRVTYRSPGDAGIR